MTRNYEMAFFNREDAVFGIDQLVREKPEAARQDGYGYRPYYPGDGTTPPADASRLPVLPGAASGTGFAKRTSRCPTAIPGPGP